jgi:hypothetical protein
MPNGILFLFPPFPKYVQQILSQSYIIYYELINSKDYSLLNNVSRETVGRKATTYSQEELNYEVNAKKEPG